MVHARAEKAASIFDDGDPDTDLYAQMRQEDMLIATRVAFTAVKIGMELTYDNDWIGATGSPMVLEGIDCGMMEESEEFVSNLDPSLDNFKNKIMGESDDHKEPESIGGSHPLGLQFAPGS